MRVPRQRLGRSGLEASRLGLAGSYGADATTVERAFHELGVDYFFVTRRAPAMIEGVKRLIASGHRDRIAIAAGANIPTGGSVKREWEKTARALGVEHIDVWHLFWMQTH